MTPMRAAVLARVASEIHAIRDRPIVRVAIDGVDGAGKTRFADELAILLGQRAIRASVDAFHHPRSTRYAQGRNSPRGFYEDSYDYPSLVDLLLEPLSARPTRRYCRAYFDHRSDSRVPLSWHDPPPRGILVFDGIFLHRPELMRFWDYTVFLEVSPRTSVRRCVDREGVPGVAYDPSDPVHARYLKGQAMYLESVDPASRCTRRIDNEDYDAPRLVDAHATTAGNSEGHLRR